MKLKQIFAVMLLCLTPMLCGFKSLDQGIVKASDKVIEFVSLTYDQTHAQNLGVTPETLNQTFEDMLEPLKNAMIAAFQNKINQATDLTAEQTAQLLAIKLNLNVSDQNMFITITYPNRFAHNFFANITQDSVSTTKQTQFLVIKVTQTVGLPYGKLEDKLISEFVYDYARSYLELKFGVQSTNTLTSPECQFAYGVDNSRYYSNAVKIENNGGIYYHYFASDVENIAISYNIANTKNWYFCALGAGFLVICGIFLVARYKKS